VLDYSFLFMLFGFVGGGNSIGPGAVLYYVPMGWLGESRIVHVAHLFILWFYASSFGTG
jgi:hypothetical protein